MLRMWWARWSIWIVGCALATAVVIGNAFYQKKQFYPTVVYITKSKPSMAVMYAQALLFVVMLGKLFRKLFFGQLRAAEFEHLVERSWYAVTETCLAFTVFRDDFSPKFLALFTLLLFLKSFHWLAEERVDYMERSPVITWVFHVRVLSLLSILFLTDVYFVNVAYQSTVTKGASVQLVFGFEYAILTTIVLNTVAKYVFHVIDMQNETPWENKAVFVLHTEVVIGFIKVVLYVVFVMIMVRVYTLPLFALRPTYLALRAFKKAVNDVIMSRRAINNMNNLYPDVTQEELAATDNVCIICREEMTGGAGAKKLPCNHIFHVSCLRSWFQRQQTCPTCRLNVLRVPATAGAGVAGGVGGAAAPGAGAGQGQNFGGGAFMGNQFPGFGGQQMFRVPQQGQGGGQVPGPFGGMWGNFPQQWNQAAAAQAQAQGAAQPQQQQQQAGGDQGQNDVPGGQQPVPGQPQPAAGGDGQNQPGDAAAAAAAGAAFAGPRAQFGGNFPPMFGMPQPQFAFRPPTTPGQTPAGGDFMAGGGVPPSAYPFSFPPMPYIPLVPPPPPLLETTGLSTEELQRMEGITRDNIEARLRCLRNVQILLDSAVVQMQQYSAIVSHINVTPPPPTPSSSTTEGPVPGSSGSGGGASTSSSFQASSSKASPPPPPTVVPVPESSSSPPKDEAAATTAATAAAAKTNGGVKEVILTSSSPNNVTEASASSSGTTSSSNNSAVPPNELDELRKRRLARLSNTATNQNQSETSATAAGGSTGEID